MPDSMFNPLELKTVKPVKSDVRLLYGMAGAASQRSLGNLVEQRILSKATKSQKLLGVSTTRAGALLAGYLLFKLVDDPDPAEELSIKGFLKGFGAGVVVGAGGDELGDRGFDLVNKLTKVGAGTTTTPSGTAQTQTAMLSAV